MRVVIADDSMTERGMVTRILTQAGHTVVQACENGEIAVTAVAAHKPDLVILDVVMPRMGGDAAALQIAQGEHVPAILFATKNTQVALQEIADRVGAAITGKPYDPPKLLASVERAYGNRRRRPLGAERSDQ